MSKMDRRSFLRGGAKAAAGAAVAVPVAAVAVRASSENTWWAFHARPFNRDVILDVVVWSQAPASALARLENDGFSWEGNQPKLLGATTPPPYHQNGIYVRMTPGLEIAQNSGEVT